MAGRPRSSSRSTIEEAAVELFIENSFARTTIDQITRRAGVSRATFFNYFSQKTDLLWVEVDEAIAQLQNACSVDATAATLRETILDLAADVNGRQVPLVLSQQELMGSSAEVMQSGLVRVAALARVFSASLDRTSAFVLAGAVSASWIEWARAGIGRRPLVDYLGAGLEKAFGGL